MSILTNLASKQSDMSSHVEFLHDLVVSEKATTVLELGVCPGVSTLAFLCGLQKTNGHLYSCDIAPCKQAIAAVTRANLGAYWTFINQDDYLVAETWDKIVDILLIDTDHTYEHTLFELQWFSPFVRKGGVILMHDTHSRFTFGIMKAIDEFLETAPKGKWLYSNERTNCFGMGVFRCGS